MRSLSTLATLLAGLAFVFWAPAAKAGATQNNNPCLNADDLDDEMVLVGGLLCIDKYRASALSGDGAIQYGLGIDDYPCLDIGEDCNNIFAHSSVDLPPSVFITWWQALQACANSGKRLLTSAEALVAARGASVAQPSDWGVEEIPSGTPTTAAEWLSDPDIRSSVTRARLTFNAPVDLTTRIDAASPILVQGTLGFRCARPPLVPARLPDWPRP